MNIYQVISTLGGILGAITGMLALWRTYRSDKILFGEAAFKNAWTDLLRGDVEMFLAGTKLVVEEIEDKYSENEKICTVNICGYTSSRNEKTWQYDRKFKTQLDLLLKAHNSLNKQIVRYNEFVYTDSQINPAVASQLSQVKQELENLMETMKNLSSSVLKSTSFYNYKFGIIRDLSDLELG